MYACFAAAGVVAQINAATAKLFLFWKSIAPPQYAGVRVSVCFVHRTRLV